MPLLETVASWLGALKLPGRVVFGMFLFCALLLVLDFAGVIILGALHPFAWVGAFFGLLLFGCLSLASAGGEGYDALRRSRGEKKVRARQQAKREESDAARSKYKTAVLKRLDYLTRDGRCHIK